MKLTAFCTLPILSHRILKILKDVYSGSVCLLIKLTFLTASSRLGVTYVLLVCFHGRWRARSVGVWGPGLRLHLLVLPTVAFASSVQASTQIKGQITPEHYYEDSSDLSDSLKGGAFGTPIPCPPQGL